MFSRYAFTMRKLLRNRITIIFTTFIPIDFPIHFDTITHGNVHLVENSKLQYISVQKIIFILANSVYPDELQHTVQTMMKCRVMRHFIWVFTVAKAPTYGYPERK